MAFTKTLLELRTAVRRRSDMPGDTFVSNSEVNDYINLGVYRLTSKLIKFYTAKRFRKEVTLSTVAGQNSYSLPADHFQTEYLRVDLQGLRYDIPRTNNAQVDTQASGSGLTWSNSGVGFGVWGEQLRFDPAPNQVHTVTHVYLATIPVTNVSGVLKAEMDTDTDTFNSEWGWHDWVVLWAAKRCLQKEESDVGSINVELEEFEQDIEAIAKDKAIGAAPKTKEVYSPTRRGRHGRNNRHRH